MRYIFRKIIELLITVLAVSVVTFTAFMVIPGDSDTVLAGTEGVRQTVEKVEENVIVQYGAWVKGALTGDFGESSQFKMPVSTLIGERLVVTLHLGTMCILIIAIISLPLGIICARKPGGFLDNAIMAISNIFMATPEFFMGMILTIIFGVTLRWFIPGKYISYTIDYVGFLTYMIMPALAVALPKMAQMIKFIRNSIITELKKDYVRTALSKGAGKNRIMYRHVLKNALIPVITFFAIIIAQVFAGSIVAEQVFSVPGIGRLLVSSVLNRDYNVCSAILLYVSIVVVVCNMTADVLYYYLNPRKEEKI